MKEVFYVGSAHAIKFVTKEDGSIRETTVCHSEYSPGVSTHTAFKSEPNPALNMVPCTKELYEKHLWDAINMLI